MFMASLKSPSEVAPSPKMVKHRRVLAGGPQRPTDAHRVQHVGPHRDGDGQRPQVVRELAAALVAPPELEELGHGDAAAQ